MQIDKKIASLLDRAQTGRAPTKEECVFLLQLPETSLEAALLRAVADSTTRRRFNNEGIVLGQIGIERGVQKYKQGSGLGWEPRKMKKPAAAGQIFGAVSAAPRSRQRDCTEEAAGWQLLETR